MSLLFWDHNGGFMSRASSLQLISEVCRKFRVKGIDT